MIGKFDKKRKEQKALLAELESIKSLLDDGELINDDFSDLAATATQKTDSDEESSKPDLNDLLDQVSIDEGLEDKEFADDELIDDGEDDDFLISDDIEVDLSSTEYDNEEIDIPVLEEMISVSAAGQLTPGALPGQKSLFDDGSDDSSRSSTNDPSKTSSPEQEIKKNADAIASAMSQSAQSSKSKESYVPPIAKSSENPFLPKHIRERLGSSIDVPGYPEKNQNLHKTYDPTTQKPNPAVESSPESKMQSNYLQDVDTAEIIDKLVEEFMPKIEKILRERLALAVLKSSQKD